MPRCHARERDAGGDLAIDQPHTAVNSRVVFETYFLAIGATGLRYDPRICIVAGLLACAQYLAISWIADAYWTLNETDLYAPFIYGAFSWSSQVSRSIMLLTATALSFIVVMRTQALVRLSTRDALTGLYNRGYFQERIASEVSRVARSGKLLTIAMVDVDHFKAFNDTHGHGAGDDVLQAIGATLQRSFRQSDIVCRWGGEEFVIAMPDTDIAAAHRRLDEVRQSLQVEARVTISAGLAAFPIDGTSAEKVLAVADARLFQAKGAGRNRIVVM